MTLLYKRPQMPLRASAVMRRYCKSAVTKVITALGLRIEHISTYAPTDMRCARVPPQTLSYCLGGGGVLISAEMARGRGLPICTYGKDGNHPFVLAARHAIKVPRAERMACISAILREYYDLVAPASAGELAGLHNGAAWNSPAWTLVMPWNRECPTLWAKMMISSIQAKNPLCRPNDDPQLYWAWVGPSNARTLKLEADRLCDVLASIENRGYQRDDSTDGDIKAVVLAGDNGRWCWQAIDGQHRAAIASALNMAECPVRILQVVRQEDAKFWPNVQNGTFSVAEALHIFNGILNGRLSAATDSWNARADALKAKIG